MDALRDWHTYAVAQRNLETGCIPTGYEMILRAAGINGIDFTTFQEEFDLDRHRVQGQPSKNNFASVAAAVKRRYGHVAFEVRRWPQGQGAAKIAFIDQQLKAGRPTLVSVLVRNDARGRGYHIFLAVASTATHLHLLNRVDGSGNAEILQIEKEEVAKRHDRVPGGDDVAYLATAGPKT